MIDVLVQNDTMKLVVEKMDDFYFLHLRLYEWNKSVLKDCKSAMLDALRTYRDTKDVKLFFAIAKDDQTLRFYRLVKPYDYSEFVTDDEGRQATVVAWETEEHGD